MIHPDRVLVAAVAPNHPPFTDGIRLLFGSLRRFGGRLAGARARAYFVGPIEPELRTYLEGLGVECRFVSPFDERCPHANKLRMLEAPPDVDVLVALDVDTVVARDFSAYLTGSAIAAKPEDHDFLTLEQWQQMFDHFELELPRERHLCSMTLRETVPFLNSGVLIIPRQHLEPLREAWISYVLELLEAYPYLPEIAPRRHFTDQFALLLALVEAELPYRALPVEMNCTTATPIHAAFGPERLAPYILHHHHQLSESGYLLLSRYESLNAVIAEVNRQLGPKPGTAARLAARRQFTCAAEE